MSVQATYTANLTVAETLSVGVPDSSTPTIVHNGFNISKNLNASSTPPATKIASFVLTLTAGAATIDLTNLASTNGAVVDGTGLHVRAFKFINPSANANAVAFTVGASNGYQLKGAAWKETLQPGDDTMCSLTAAPAIGSGAKTIDVTGTGTQAFNVEILLG